MRRKMAREERYLVFLDSEGMAIGLPNKVGSPEHADAMLENMPVDTHFHFIANSKKELLDGDYGLVGEDFDI